LLQPLVLVVLLGVVLLILGPDRITRVGRTLGASWRALVGGFQEATRERPSAPLPARACPRCEVWAAETANYCTRCGTALR
jgi:hypothetical protein